MEIIRPGFSVYGCKVGDMEDIFTYLPDQFDTFVDVFGGSSCVSINIKNRFKNYRVIYNDKSYEYYTIVKGLRDENQVIIEYMENKNKQLKGCSSHEEIKQLWNETMNSNDKYKCLYGLTYSYKGKAKHPLLPNNKCHYRKKGFKHLEKYKEFDIEVQNKDFRNIIETHKNDNMTVMYLDPEYISGNNGNCYDEKITHKDFEYIRDLIFDKSVKAYVLFLTSSADTYMIRLRATF